MAGRTGTERLSATQSLEKKGEQFWIWKELPIIKAPSFGRSDKPRTYRSSNFRNPLAEAVMKLDADYPTWIRKWKSGNWTFDFARNYFISKMLKPHWSIFTDDASRVRLIAESMLFCQRWIKLQGGPSSQKKTWRLANSPQASKAIVVNIMKIGLPIFDLLRQKLMNFDSRKARIKKYSFRMNLEE